MMETLPDNRYSELSREQAINLYNELTERRWDVADLLAGLDADRAELMNRLKDLGYD